MRLANMRAPYAKIKRGICVTAQTKPINEEWEKFQCNFFIKLTHVLQIDNKVEDVYKAPSYLSVSGEIIV